jgi:thiamine biosynthesis lipoprotein
VTDAAVCTSGDYERGEHLVDPRTGTPSSLAASVTVVAPTAMLADALATAAFILGPVEGLALLERHGVEGLILTPSLERFETADLPRS